VALKGKQRQSRREELLRLWMGDTDEEVPPPRRRVSTPVVLACIAVAAVAGLALAKYAVDVLVISIVLVGGGLLLHFVGTWLAESDILSPGWFLVMLLATALAGWALVHPMASAQRLGRYVPGPVAKFFEWSESKGWGQRLLIGPGTERSAPSTGVAPGSAPVSPPSRSVEPPRSATASGPTLSITSSAAAVRVGQPVSLTAHLTGASTSATPGIVTFYDGLLPLGQAQLASRGRSRTASLTITLPSGRHRITASAGLTGPRSEAMLITVTR
jgi:hypothetical protein